MFQSRTHTCGELRKEHAGQQVTIVGWMENVREVGSSLAFVVVRDFYGITQVVIETEELMAVVKDINKESTISVTGLVRERSNVNHKIPTGEIEVVPGTIRVLGRCTHQELPFEIRHSRNADESLRLRYRYLDLRNPEVQQKIVLRSQIISALRSAMTEHGFLEITTPILTASSPEGARDYLVPARKHPGKFYALPQAPQQFKQILMASGIDRYFQIAPCFRDEDARGDRSPGEFYQLDMEMAFASKEDVFAVIEDVLPPVFETYGVYDRASGAPFVRIPYAQAMEEYGTDKPDLRIDLKVADVTDLLQEIGFDPFRDQSIKAVPVSDCHLTRKAIDKICAEIEAEIAHHSNIIAVMRRRMTGNDFIDLIGQLRFQQRWTRTPRVPATTVLGHSLLVAYMTYLQDCDDGVDDRTLYNDFYTALFHDLPEVLTKDVITPVKANVGGLSEMLASYEEEMMESKIVPMLPEDMRDEFRFLVYEPFSEREDARFGSVRGPGIKVWDTMAAYMEARMSRYYGVTSRVLRDGEAALAEKLRAYRTSADTEALMADLERVCSF